MNKKITLLGHKFLADVFFFPAFYSIFKQAGNLDQKPNSPEDNDRKCIKVYKNSYEKLKIKHNTVYLKGYIASAGTAALFQQGCG